MRLGIDIVKLKRFINFSFRRLSKNMETWCFATSSVFKNVQDLRSNEPKTYLEGHFLFDILRSRRDTEKVEMFYDGQGRMIYQGHDFERTREAVLTVKSLDGFRLNSSILDNPDTRLVDTRTT